MQWLTVDRATLTPTGNGTSWFDGTASGEHGIDALTSALCHPDDSHPNCSASLDQLVIFSVQPPGTLRGRATMGEDGNFMPASTDVSGSLDTSLYDIVLRPSTPWPYTAGGSFPQQTGCAAPGNDVAAYAAALSYIAIGVKEPTYASNLRTGYFKRNLREDWSDQRQDLAGLGFEMGHGFSEAEFCNLKAQILSELEWLDKVKGLFDGYQQAVLRTGDKEAFDLEQIGSNITAAVSADDDANVAWSVGSFFGNLGSAAILYVNPEATALLAAWEALVVYELTQDLVSESGIPLGDQVNTEVTKLADQAADRVFDTANGLDRLRQVIVSDYGRLSALGPVADNAGWTIDTEDTAIRLTNASGGFFYSELLPIPYGVHALMDGLASNKLPFTDLPKYCENVVGSLQWDGIADSGWLAWMGDFDRDGSQGWFPTTFVLGKHSLSSFSNNFPPKSVTDDAFIPISQGGLGMQLSRYMWEQYATGFPPTDIFGCQGDARIP